MRARVLAVLALTATVAMVVTAVAIAAFGSPETADPERRTGENDGIAPNRQLAADANGEALWLSETSAAGPGGPSGVVATWLRRTGGMGTPLRLAVSRLDGTSWETPKIYDGSFTSATVSATSAGAVLLAGGRDEEIWGTQVGSISAPWPGSLERLSPQTDG